MRFYFYFLSLPFWGITCLFPFWSLVVFSRPLFFGPPPKGKHLPFSSGKAIWGHSIVCLSLVVDVVLHILDNFSCCFLLVLLSLLSFCFFLFFCFCFSFLCLSFILIISCYFLLFLVVFFVFLFFLMFLCFFFFFFLLLLLFPLVLLIQKPNSWSDKRPLPSHWIWCKGAPYLVDNWFLLGQNTTATNQDSVTKIALKIGVLHVYLLCRV